MAFNKCLLTQFYNLYINIFKDFLFREKGREREMERVRETSMWERNIDWLPSAHTPPGIKPATWAWALNGNWTGNPLVWRRHPTSWDKWARVIIYILKLVLTDLNQPGTGHPEWGDIGKMYNMSNSCRVWVMCRSERGCVTEMGLSKNCEAGHHRDMV